MTSTIIALVALAILWLFLPKTVVVTRVVDGDSLEVMRGKKRLRIRVAGLDAPEYKQAYGRAARRALEDLVLSGTVRICIGKVDKYGRIVTRVLVNGRPVHWTMIRAGHAWPDSIPGVLLSVPARLFRRGLWRDPARMHPRRWRQLHALQHPGVVLS